MTEPAREDRAEWWRRTLVDEAIRRLDEPPLNLHAEVARLAAESRQRELEVHRAAERIDADFERADNAVETLTRLGITRRDLRKRASLVLRCQDCDGQTFAFVTYVQGRPLMWARTDRGSRRGHYLWLDGPFWGTCGWCNVREWTLDVADLREITPPSGEPQATERVSHDGIVGAVP